jgi:hypothetical protein
MMQIHDLCVRMGAEKRAYWHKISQKEFYLDKFRKIRRMMKIYNIKVQSGNHDSC